MMRKRILVFLFVISICLFGLFNSFNLAVYAQDLPERAVRLNYFEHKFVQEHELIYEYTVTYLLPFRVSENLSNDDVYLIYKIAYGFRKSFAMTTNSYVLESVVTEFGYSELHFRVTLAKSMMHLYLDEDNPDLYADVIPFFTEHSAMYVKSDYVQPVKFMGNLFFAEPNYDDFVEVDAAGELHYLYYGVNVYLPDGTKEDLRNIANMIKNKAEVFEGYDFVAFYFNLTPRSLFTNPTSTSVDQVYGLSYIVYDIAGMSTIFYDYLGREIIRKDTLYTISNPRIRIPAIDDKQYQQRSAYEEGKIEGIEIGKEQGYNEGYGKGYNAGYIKGKNDAHFEDLDLFSYLEALFGDEGLGRLLRLELLPGVSLGAVIMIPLAFWLVSFIMRWFR